MLLYQITPPHTTKTDHVKKKADNSHIIRDVKGTYDSWGRKALPSNYYTDMTIHLITIFSRALGSSWADFLD